MTNFSYCCFLKLRCVLILFVLCVKTADIGTPSKIVMHTSDSVDQYPYYFFFSKLCLFFLAYFSTRLPCPFHSLKFYIILSCIS